MSANLMVMERKNNARLSSKERREAIVNAVKNIFAEKAFHGTTTKNRPPAAGVSEALLFKHFPGKESLYDSIITWLKGPATKAARPERKTDMKKTLTLTIGFAFFFAAASAFAADNAGLNAGEELYNGITRFDSGSQAREESAVPVDKEAAALFNGITYFAPEQFKGEPAAFAAGGTEAVEKPHNGVTVF